MIGKYRLTNLKKKCLSDHPFILKEDNFATHIYEQANKIVDLLLDDVVDLTNDGTCGELNEKRYFNTGK